MKLTKEQIERAKSSKDYLEALDNKLSKGEKLTYSEEDDLGSFKGMSEDVFDLPDSLSTFKFRHIYIRHFEDLTFKNSAYKRNPDVNIAEFISLEELTSLNNEEYDAEKKDNLMNYLIKNKVLIETTNEENIKASEFLKSSVADWAQVCLDKDSADLDIMEMINETLRHIKKNEIEKFLQNPYDKSVQESFLVLSKAYYILIEAKKIFERIIRKNEPRIYTLNGVNIHFTFRSVIHILYGHFAQIVSSNALASKKSFHNTKIDPYFLNIQLRDIFQLFEESGYFKNVSVDNKLAFNIKFHGIFYQMYLMKIPNINNELQISTFFPVEEPQRLDAINQLKELKLTENLSIFL